ncbi:MAG: nitrous oxide-stimulated promoter family protein [Candidatus Limisoma sp.]|nr:nitrous oxide-stimulated promoter family protein [Candidatus Limisoma sp.]
MKVDNYQLMKSNRIEEEKLVVEQMIRLYCRKCEGNAELCLNCRELLAYAHGRLSACRFGNRKPTCKKCPIHCYRPQMKEQIRMVMRWSGPRMLFYHPLAAVRHLLREMFCR